MSGILDLAPERASAALAAPITWMAGLSWVKVAVPPTSAAAGSGDR